MLDRVRGALSHALVLPVKIELGAGAAARPGWLAVDLNPAHADIVADALSLPFEDASVTELRAVDVLEHLSYRDTGRALAEWARVCAPAAEIYVQVPDAETIMRWFAADATQLHRMGRDGRTCTALAGAEWRLLGGHADGDYVEADGDWRWNAHYSLWSSESLRSALELAGFDEVRIERNGHPNLLCRARRALIAPLN